jgi:hypothetical protein
MEEDDDWRARRQRKEIGKRVGVVLSDPREGLGH